MTLLKHGGAEARQSETAWTPSRSRTRCRWATAPAPAACFGLEHRPEARGGPDPARKHPGCFPCRDGRGPRFFPRTDPITLDDKDVEFIVKLSRLEVKEKCEFADMTFGGQLVLEPQVDRPADYRPAAATRSSARDPDSMLNIPWLPS